MLGRRAKPAAVDELLQPPGPKIDVVLFHHQEADTVYSAENRSQLRNSAGVDAATAMPGVFIPSFCQGATPDELWLKQRYLAVSVCRKIECWRLQGNGR